MRLFFYIFLNIFFCLCLEAQEICNNGIDDDNDGKIDLHDSECSCEEIVINSLIPNHSFEDYNDCPALLPEYWIQAVNSRVDYINSNSNCSSVFNEIQNANLIPFPDGTGIIGENFMNNRKGYAGVCLLSPLIAGQDYQLTFYTAALLLPGSASLGSSNKIKNSQPKNNSLDLDPLSITLYGTDNCNNLPITSDTYVNIYQSPPTYGPKWIEIGSVSYDPKSEWKKLTITFKPTININAITLGSPQKLPLSYPYQPFRGDYIGPYFLFDNLILNSSELFGVNIKREGFFCENNLTLYANVTINITSSIQYQWYKNGIALVGATNNFLSIQNNTGNYGDYTVKVIVNDQCLQSSPYIVNNIMPEPVVNVQQPTCDDSQGVITILSPAAEYSFDNGLTWGTNNVSPKLNPKTYIIKTRNIEGCEASRYVIIQPSISFPNIYIANNPVIYYQNSVAQPLSAGGVNLTWYNSKLGGLGTNIAPTPITSNLGTTYYYVSQTINGCESSRHEIKVEIIPLPYNFDYPHFFTPNGDGINDTWNINSLNKLNQATIYIYDRFGKLIKRIIPNEMGWDGTYNGLQLPANDYWFKVIYKDYTTEKEFRSHFSLKR